jgi:hypothetical protein
MKHTSIYGIALIIGALGTIITMIFHPTGSDLLHQNKELAQRGEMITVATHSLALISIPILFYGFSGVYRQFGKNSPLASTALIAYLFAAFAVMCSAIFSGLVAPNLTRQILTANESSKELLHLLLDYNFQLNQAFTKVFVVASTSSVIMWSLLIFKASSFAKIIGIIGFIIAGISLLVFFAGHLKLDVHGFGLFAFGQSIWIVLLGIFLFRSIDTVKNS